MKNDIVKLSKSLNKLGFKQESLEVLSIIKKSQDLNSLNPKFPEQYKQLMLELSVHLRESGGLLSGRLINRIFSKKKSPGIINAELGLLLVSLRQWYGPDNLEPIQEKYMIEIRDIREGLELLNNKTDMSDTNEEMCLPSNQSRYCGLSLDGISEKVGSSMIRLSDDILTIAKSL